MANATWLASLAGGYTPPSKPAGAPVDHWRKTKTTSAADPAPDEGSAPAPEPSGATEGDPEPEPTGAPREFTWEPSDLYMEPHAES